MPKKRNIQVKGGGGGQGILFYAQKKKHTREGGGGSEIYLKIHVVRRFVKRVI